MAPFYEAELSTVYFQRRCKDDSSTVYSVTKSSMYRKCKQEITIQKKYTKILSAREWNMNWRMWHIEKDKSLRSMSPLAILRNSPQLWESKMEAVLSRKIPKKTIKSENTYFRHVKPQEPIVVQESGLKKALTIPQPSNTKIDTESNAIPEDDTCLRAEFTRYHNNKGFHSRVAFLGDESSVRELRGSESFRNGYEKRRKKPGIVEFEQKTGSPPTRLIPRLNEEPCLFSLPKDGHIYSSHPSSECFLPFAIPCIPKDAIRNFMYNPKAVSYSGYVDMRHADSQTPWQKRWIVIRHNYLLEFVDQDEDYPIGVVSLVSTIVAISESTATVELSLHEHRISSRCKPTFGTSAPKYSLPSKMRSTRSANNIALSVLHPVYIVELKPYGQNKSGESHAIKLYDSLRAAKFIDLDNIFAVAKNHMGQGRFAHVLPAIRKDSGEKCAVKVIRKHEFWALVENGKERTDTISREIATQLYVSNLRDPDLGIVRLWDVFETKDLIILELELMEETDLYQIMLSEKVLSEHKVSRIVDALASTIGIFQRKNVAHRDLKLSNIVFPPPLVHQDSFQHPKVVDFGMAAFVGSDGYLVGRCGTPGYVAPEILDAKPSQGYENTIDLFSLGVIAYTLLCGYEPFYGPDEKSLIASNRKCEVTFHESSWSKVSSDAKSLVRGLLNRDAGKRLTVEMVKDHPWIARHRRFERERVFEVPAQSNAPRRADSSSCCIS